MTAYEFKICQHAYRDYGKLSPAYVMKALKVTAERADEIIKLFFNYIDNNSKWRTVKSFVM